MIRKASLAIGRANRLPAGMEIAAIVWAGPGTMRPIAAAGRPQSFDRRVGQSEWAAPILAADRKLATTGHTRWARRPMICFSAAGLRCRRRWLTIYSSKHSRPDATRTGIGGAAGVGKARCRAPDRHAVKGVDRGGQPSISDFPLMTLHTPCLRL